MRFILSYDIADDKRRRLVVKCLERCAHRVQYSVFEGELPMAKVRRMWWELQEIIKPEVDGLMLVPVCVTCDRARLDAGTTLRFAMEDPMV